MGASKGSAKYTLQGSWAAGLARAKKSPCGSQERLEGAAKKGWLRGSSAHAPGLARAKKTLAPPAACEVAHALGCWWR
jgi:hypothetical protein